MPGPYIRSGLPRGRLLDRTPREDAREMTPEVGARSMVGRRVRPVVGECSRVGDGRAAGESLLGGSRA